MFVEFVLGWADWFDRDVNDLLAARVLQAVQRLVTAIVAAFLSDLTRGDFRSDNDGVLWAHWAARRARLIEPVLALFLPHRFHAV